MEAFAFGIDKIGVFLVLGHMLLNPALVFFIECAIVDLIEFSMAIAGGRYSQRAGKDAASFDCSSQVTGVNRIELNRCTLQSLRNICQIGLPAISRWLSEVRATPSDTRPNAIIPEGWQHALSLPTPSAVPSFRTDDRAGIPSGCDRADESYPVVSP